MIKCLFAGHDWEYIVTFSGKRTKPHWCHGVINSTIHDLSKEYYKCSKCGLWRCKEFVDHTLSKTTYSAECPIEQEVLKSAKTVIQ